MDLARSLLGEKQYIQQSSLTALNDDSVHEQSVCAV